MVTGVVPLVVRSHYSLMWGVASPGELCRAARQRGFSHLALTDTDNLYGLWPFLRACERAEVVPIVGAEVTDPRRGSTKRAVCLVEDDRGYRNLCRLLTRRHLDPAFDLEAALAEHKPGLVVLSSSPPLVRGCHGRGVEVVAALPRRSSATREVRRVARQLGLPLVATPSSFFVDPQDHVVHRTLRAIDLKTSLSRLDRLGPKEAAPADAWLAPAHEYGRRFGLDPEAMLTSHQIAERCAFRGPHNGTLLPPWRDQLGRSPAQVLREAALAGACSRYGDDLSEPVVERLERELGVIEGKGFSSYFLVVQQIIQRSPRICGRGSGAASLVAYCLGITNVCPLKHDLYFERFLNPGRADPPDIDVDFAWDERDAVLSWVLESHQGRAAMVCNHVLFQPRMALREVARVFGIPEREIGRVMRRLPRVWREIHFRTSTDALPGPLVRGSPSPAQRCELPDPWPTILQLARRLVGAPRYLSVHAGGIVITPGPIDEVVPVQRAPKGVPVVQWEKEGSEEGGLVKIDLLGNRSLGVIRDALANIRDNGVALSEERWEPEDDPATQDAVAAGRTIGCFYIESPAMRLLQQRTGRGDFAHLVIHSSIIRPAANEFIREYVRRLKGGAYEPIHPLLSDVLDESYGILVYQEDVSRTAIALAGFSHAEADGLRKILSKKDRQRQLEDYRERFVAGARARGVSEAQIERVWSMMVSFEGYSFCKPHSASYARVSFQAAYLKVHHPAEFIAAVISNGGGFYSTFAYVSEARRMGLAISPPCVNYSRARWYGKDQAVRVGLGAIKGLSGGAQHRIVAGRDAGPYRSLEDLLDRTRPDESEARALIFAGACDGLSGGDRERAALLWRLLRWRRGRGGGTADLFASASQLEGVPDPDLPPQEERLLLRREYSVLGFLCDRHPMVLFSDALPRQIVKVRDLHRHVNRRVRVAGWLITAKVVPTRRGEPMEFVTFEDETGTVEATFFPEAYARFEHLLDWNRPFLLAGRVEEEGAITLTVDWVRRLETRQVQGDRIDVAPHRRQGI